MKHSRVLQLSQVGVVTSVDPAVSSLVSVVLAWGWLLIVVLMMWIVWKVYLYLKHIDYVSAIQWTFLQINIPEEVQQTPKAMENAFAVWDGIHKNPDLIERYFEGYMEAWYSCEIFCTRGRARYIMVVPTVHRTFFEGVIYGQYPQAEIREIEDYTQRYSYEDIDKTFDLYGTEIILGEDDILPIKSYRDYEDTFGDDERYIDPHQALIEAYTNVAEGDEFWVQILVRPISGKDIKKWAERGEAEIDKLAGKDPPKKQGAIRKVFDTAAQAPAELVKAGVSGPQEASRGGGGSIDFPRVSAGDTAKMDGILRKITNGGYRTKIRVIYLAPMGKITKPNISRVIGGFKQYNSYHLNNFLPDPAIKTNQPNYFFKKTRRYRRKREVFLNFQWRDFWGVESGYMMSDEELATIYHLPSMLLKAPSVERGSSGLGGAPDNVPYVESEE